MGLRSGLHLGRAGASFSSQTTAGLQPEACARCQPALGIVNFCRRYLHVERAQCEGPLSICHKLEQDADAWPGASR